MSDEEAPPQSDKIDDAPHPRETSELFGQEAAEAAFLDAAGSGRMHHAWLLTGPRGVGKATLAWRIARYLVAAPTDQPGLLDDALPPASLDMPTDHPVWRRSVALSEPRISLCRKAWDEKAKRFKTMLTVDEVRNLKAQFALSAPDGGWRCAIIDAADDMNRSAENALLKLLEEPPARTVLLLVCHQPGRLLPTIRSRCRVLRLRALGEEDMARALAAAGQPLEDVALLHRLTGGSVGDAIRLQAGDGPAFYTRLLELLAAAPNIPRDQVSALAAGCVGAANVEAYGNLILLVSLILARLARAGCGQTEDLLEAEARLAARLCPGPNAARAWAELQQSVTERAGKARAVNLDPEQVILDMFIAIERTAARVAHAAA